MREGYEKLVFFQIVRFVFCRYNEIKDDAWSYRTNYFNFRKDKENERIIHNK